MNSSICQVFLTAACIIAGGFFGILGFCVSAFAFALSLFLKPAKNPCFLFAFAAAFRFCLLFELTKSVMPVSYAFLLTLIAVAFAFYAAGNEREFQNNSSVCLFFLTSFVAVCGFLFSQTPDYSKTPSFFQICLCVFLAVSARLSMQDCSESKNKVRVFFFGFAVACFWFVMPAPELFSALAVSALPLTASGELFCACRGEIS